MSETGWQLRVQGWEGVVIFEGEWMRLSVPGAEYYVWLVESSGRSYCFTEQVRPWGDLSECILHHSFLTELAGSPHTAFSLFLACTPLDPAPALPMPRKPFPSEQHSVGPPCHLLRGPYPKPPSHSYWLTFLISFEHISPSGAALCTS